MIASSSAGGVLPPCRANRSWHSQLRLAHCVTFILHKTAGHTHQGTLPAMNLLKSVSATAAGGLALGQFLLNEDRARYDEVNEWSDDMAALDRHQLINHQPLPPLEEPPLPAEPALRTGRQWLLIPLGVWIIPAGLAGLIVATTVTASSNVGAGAFAGVIAFVVVSVLALPAAVLVGSLINLHRVRSNQKLKTEHAVRTLRHDIWLFREQARQELAQGVRPVAYLEAIGLDPQRF